MTLHRRWTIAAALIAGVLGGMALATETCACGPKNPRWRLMVQPYEKQIEDAAKSIGIDFKLPPLKSLREPPAAIEPEIQPTPTNFRTNV